MALRTYDPTAVKVLVNGVPISGFADGDFIVAEFDEDAWSKHRGTDGDTTRVYMSQNGGTIAIHLADSSPMNSILDGFAKLDNVGKIFPVAIMIVDTLGGSTISGMQSWLRKDPGKTFGRDVFEPEWMYDVDLLVIDHQGGF